MASAEECVRGNPVTTGGAQPAVAAVFESKFGPLSDTPSAPLTRNAVAFDWANDAADAVDAYFRNVQQQSRSDQGCHSSWTNYINGNTVIRK
jgi:hypothetical protein